MSERFYVNLPLIPGPVALDGPEAHHLASVCRLRAGDEVCLFNGDGRQYPARITHAARREVSLEILRVEQPQRELPILLEVAAPLPKGDRGQFLIEKLTEIGVARFVPLECQRTVVHPREGKLDKLQRHVIEASKQCGRNILMQIEQATIWKDYIRPRNEGELRILAHPYNAGNLNTLLTDQPPPREIRIAVGPEGGFTDEELAQSTQFGWHTVDLGPRVLRVETAALVLATLMIRWMCI